MHEDKKTVYVVQPPVAGPAPTPLSWRLAIAAAVLIAGSAAYILHTQNFLGPREQAAVGVFCFLGIVATLSANLRAVNWRTIGLGFALQILLAVCVIKVPPVYAFFDAIGFVVKKFLEFTSAGSQFVFGNLANPTEMNKVFPPNHGFIFAFSGLPTVIFVASFFTVLYYFGVLQFLVRLMAKAMMFLLQTSGAETLSVTANIFMGQTEAPLIIKPYIPRMTQSELLTLMVGGMAHVSGGIMAVYIGLGADPVAILATSVMASPCTLYLTKLFLPELEVPETRGEAQAVVERQHVNVIDAAASGASEGMRLAINIAAMLIAFLAFIELFNALLKAIPVEPQLSLQRLFSWMFAPVAFLIGVEGADIPKVADLLGTKLVGNELLAYVKFHEYVGLAAQPLSPRAQVLASYALTGFANFASIGIQIGGIGALAPTRRHDLARFGLKALFVGFLVTLINAALAGMLLQLPDTPLP
ncbi:MAG TPA: nucleoside transporter C-terminal domain-containing protein [Gemmataceae bacterium]|nr:nucleoside transporter C-terminal domain-containing protein [Gemmataceae bacterium]